MTETIKSNKQFALYRGDEFIDIGTLEELAENQKVTLGTMMSIATLSYRKRHLNNPNRMNVYEVEDD